MAWTEPYSTISANHGGGGRRHTDTGVVVSVTALAMHDREFGGGAYERALQGGVYLFS